MNTIKERAYEYGKDFIGSCDGYEAFAEQEDVTRAYIAGATEQRKIDIDKACEFWFTRLQGFLGEGLANGCVEEFRKAMEEN